MFFSSGLLGCFILNFIFISYEGPFRVITSSPKVFTIERGGKLETISVDRLKPAHLDFDMPVPTPTSRPRNHSYFLKFKLTAVCNRDSKVSNNPEQNDQIFLGYR